MEKRILQAALELIAKNGINKFDLVSLGRELDLSSSHLLYHISSLDEVIAKLLKDMFLNLNHKIKLQTTEASTNSERLKQYLASIYSELMENENHHSLYRQTLALGPHQKEISTMLSHSSSACKDYLTILLNDTQKAKSFQVIIVGLLCQNKISKQEFMDYFK